MITELVVNHTSDQHPWFQAARRAPPRLATSATTTSGATTTEAIRRDAASSSPTPRSRTGPGTRWRSAYYWHRFFSHQPDLNFDNPQVLKAVIRVMRFWLDMGVDGFRLDAMPYLCEREGTIDENLPETHAVIKRIRAALDAHYPEPAAARRGEPVAGGRVRVLRRGGRVPHGLPLPAHAADVHGDRAGGPLPGDGDHGADARHPGELPVGGLPAQPRRADARDGDRRRARLHVPDVRRRRARADQPRHPPPPRAADGERPSTGSS